MKIKLNMKSIVLMIIAIACCSILFINISFATDPEKNSNEINTTKSENNTNNEEEIQLGKYILLKDAKLKVIPLISAIDLGDITKDTEVEVTEVLNCWVKINTTDGKQGWIINKIVNGTKTEYTLKSTKEQQSANETNNETVNESGNNETTEIAANESSNNETTETTNESNNNEQTSQVSEATSGKTMYINTQTVNLRESASTSSKILKQLSVNTEVTIISTSDGWSYINVSGTKGYVSTSLLSDSKQTAQTTSRSGMYERQSKTNTTTTDTTSKSEEKKTDSKTNTNTTNNVASTNNSTNTTSTQTSGNDVVSYAKQFLGYKYVYGGSSPSGFDCSGFTQYVYKHFGVTLNRTAAGQYGNGTQVTSLQSGDLVMFGKSGISHVGIYIGGNSFIHAANKSEGVRIDTLSSGYYKINYVGARRVIQ